MPSKDEIRKLFEELEDKLGIQKISLEFLPFNQETYSGGKSQVLIKEYEQMSACARVETKTIWINSLKIDNDPIGIHAPGGQ